MTYKEARNYILANYFDGDEDVRAFVGGDEEHWAMKCAVEALEKQIPKKTTDDEAFGSCPACGYVFNSELVNEYDIKHCPFCGQALDFSERSDTDEN